MKKIFVSVVMFFLITFISGQEKEHTKLFWKENQKLLWEDFKGNADQSVNNEAAQSFCGMQYASCPFSGKKYTYKVSSFFVPDLSWGKVQTDDVLRHEQLHFDIAEVYARKLRKAFAERNVLPEKSRSQVYNPLFREYVKTQDRYDRETHHGILTEKNELWERKIKKELLALDGYKETLCY